MCPRVLQTVFLAGYISVQCMVGMVARSSSLDVARVHQVVTLESSWDPAAVRENDGGPGVHAVGLWQFHPDTWTWACELVGYAEWANPINRLDPVMSTVIACRMIERGYGYLWTGWRMTE